MRILITGTSSGIGQFLAEHLGQAGHSIWGLARSPQTDFEAACRANGINFSSSLCDVSDWGQVQRVRDQVQKSWDSVDALICCSGVQAPIGPAMQADPALWSQNIRVNLDGTFYPIRAFHDLLARPGKRSKVVCFSGGGATSPRPNFSAYAAAKCAVVRLVETLSQEWQGSACDINAIAPGAIFTKMTEETLAVGAAVAGHKEFALAAEQKEKGDAPLQKVGGLVDFLLSSDSDGISGRLISAPWDPWPNLKQHKAALESNDIFTLRRIRPEDRGLKWD
ncbi:MAG TPA: SDR family oxidoreductase [Candidatus Saccharimonadales bacterium]|nr:SDR family oxidoreductase [Candidatus Saccharimonadales bacterium]